MFISGVSDSSLFIRYESVRSYLQINFQFNRCSWTFNANNVWFKRDSKREREVQLDRQGNFRYNSIKNCFFVFFLTSCFYRQTKKLCWVITWQCWVIIITLFPFKWFKISICDLRRYHRGRRILMKGLCTIFWPVNVILPSHSGSISRSFVM